MKQVTRNHFQYYGLFYVILGVIVIGLWTTVFQRMNAIKDHERVHIFVAGTLTYETLEEELLYYLSGDDGSIKQVTVSFQPPSERLFFGVFETVLINGTDLVLIPETMLNQGFAKTYFIPIDDSYLTFVSEDKIYREFGDAYGILVYEPGVYSPIDNYLISDQNVKYYAFIAPKSVHLSTYQLPGQSLDNPVLNTLKWLLGVNE